MIPAAHNRLGNILRAAAPLLLIALAVAVLLRFPPARNSFYPRCPIQEFLNLQCPGCGATRALAALLHGHLAEAIHFNALVTFLLPFGVAYRLYSYHRFLQRKTLRWPQMPPVATCAAFAVAAVFTVVRNLPLHFF
jgi:hypothetical protein